MLQSSKVENGENFEGDEYRGSEQTTIQKLQKACFLQYIQSQSEKNTVKENVLEIDRNTFQVETNHEKLTARGIFICDFEEEKIQQLYS